VSHVAQVGRHPALLPTDMRKVRLFVHGPIFFLILFFFSTRSGLSTLPRNFGIVVVFSSFRPKGNDPWRTCFLVVVCTASFKLVQTRCTDYLQQSDYDGGMCSMAPLPCPTSNLCVRYRRHILGTEYRQRIRER
jgi:hypothetical protein